MRHLAILIGLALALSPAIAQDKPNFSGKWVLDTAASDFGDFPAPDSQINVVDHQEPNIHLTQTIRGEAVPGGEATSDRHYTTDAKENTNKIGGREIKSTTRWDNHKLVTIVKLETPDGTVEIKDSWELGGEGKQLVVTRDFKGPQGERNQKLVFTKQK